VQLDDWVNELAAELGVPAELDMKALLDATRDAAHAVERPAGPLTTYLIGYKMGASGGSLADVCAQVQRLAAEWAARAEDA
jgi:hypothetical protein